MSSWQRIAAVTLKELKQLGRDRLTFGMIVGIPLLQMMLFGFAINFDVRELRAGVVDSAHTARSRQLVAELTATQVLKITQQVESPAELQRLMRAGKIVIGIVIPADFERRLLDHDRAAAQILLDGSEPTLEGAARGLAALPAFHRQGVAGGSAQLFEIRTEYNPEKRTAVQIVPALIGVILNMTMVIFTSGAIVRERERGNLELLITTPVKSAELMLGKLIPYVLIGLIQTTLILSVGHALFDVPINGNLFDLYVAAMLFIAATLSLGLLISTVVKTQFQAFQLAFLTMLPSILMSGFMFPFDGMPKAAQYIAQILPLTHFNDLVRGIVLRGAQLADFPVPIAKLLTFLAVTLTLAMLRFRKRLD